MRYLVTGATGLLGSHVTDLLVSLGERPRVLAQPGVDLNGLNETRAEVRWGDMAERASLEAAVDRVDVVLHCAARTGPWGDEAEFQRVNVRGLQTLVEVAIDAGVRRIVHVSSITVHGNDVRGTADESTPLRIEPNPYSRSKVAGELLLEKMIRERGAPITIVRPGWIYGPRDHASFARFAALLERGGMVMIGSGRNRLPLIYVRDAACGVVLAAQADRAEGRTYLLVNDETVTQRGYLDAIAAELGVQRPVKRLPYRLALTLGAIAESAGRLSRSHHPPAVTRFGVQLLGGENRFVINRARQELGFAPEVMLGEGVKRSVEWYRSSRAPSARSSGVLEPV